MQNTVSIEEQQSSYGDIGDTMIHLGKLLNVKACVVQISPIT